MKIAKRKKRKLHNLSSFFPRLFFRSRCMLICLRYLCVSIYLRLPITRVQDGLFRRPAIIHKFSSAVDSVGLASTTHTILYPLFVLVLLQSSIVQYLSKVIKKHQKKKKNLRETLKILEFQGLDFANT